VFYLVNLLKTSLNGTLPVFAATFKWQQLLAVSLVKEHKSASSVDDKILTQFRRQLQHFLDCWTVTNHMPETELVGSRFICNCGWTCLKFKSNLCLHIAVYYESWRCWNQFGRCKAFIDHRFYHCIFCILLVISINILDYRTLICLLFFILLSLFWKNKRRLMRSPSCLCMCVSLHPAVRQWLRKYVPAATNKHATVDLVDAVFSAQLVLHRILNM
jgi:hypothetical protein